MKPARPASATAPSWSATARDDQAVSDIELRQIQKVGVLASPRAALEISGEPREPRIEILG